MSIKFLCIVLMMGSLQQTTASNASGNRLAGDADRMKQLGNANAAADAMQQSQNDPEMKYMKEHWRPLRSYPGSI